MGHPARRHVGDEAASASRDAGWFAARAYPIAVVIPFLLAVWQPPSLNATLVTACGLFVAGALGITAVLGRPRKPRRPTALALVLSLAAAVWFLLASAWASNPAVSLFAPFGASGWALTAAWVWAGFTVANGRALRETVAAISAAGALFALAALYEAVAHGVSRSQGYAAGFFENSTSAGEFFALAIMTATVGILITRGRAGRISFALAGVICTIGLISSSSRTAVLGLAVAGIFAVTVVKVANKPGAVRLLSVAPPVAALLLTIAGVLAANGVVGESARALVGRLGTDRDVIWRSAWAQFSQSPIIGKGLAQFSAVITWTGLPTGKLEFNATADPHNTLLAAAIGGGVIGLALALISVSTLLNALLSAPQGRQTEYPFALITAAPVLVLGMGLVGWVSAATLLAAAALTGAALGASASAIRADTDEPLTHRTVVRASGIAVGILALSLGLFHIQPLMVLSRFVGTNQVGATPLSSEEAESLYRRFPLPGIGTRALEALGPDLRTGETTARQRATDLIELTRRDAARDASHALRSMTTAQALAGNDPSGFQLFENLVAAGHEADPTCGLWYAFAASEGRRLGLSSKATVYAEEALQYPQDEATRVWLTEMR